MKNPALRMILSVAALLILLGCPSAPDESCAADPYEPNETLAAVYYLGTIEEASPEVSYAARISSQGDRDFYRIYAEEGTHACMPGTPQHYRVRIRLVPPAGQNYDLYVYDDAQNALDSSVTAGDAEESITLEWDGECGVDDSQYIRIEVRPADSAWDCEDYTLYIDMWQI